MSNTIILLGMLMDSPKYGYEIKNCIEVCYSQFAEVSFSSIYFLLDKFQKKGFLTKKNEKKGPRPSRNVYTITAKGKKFFLQELQKDIFKLHKVYDPYYVGVSFMKHLDTEQVKKSFFDRKEKFAKHLKFLKLQKSKLKNKLDKFNESIINRGIMYMQNEIEWINNTIKGLE